MKKITPVFLVIVLFLASCSSEETIQQEETSLKSYKLSRDSQGKYSIDYEVKENTTTSFNKNLENNYNEIYLEEGNSSQQTNKRENLSLENSILKLGLYENGEKSKSIIIEDDNIVFAKGGESDEYLEAFTMEVLTDEGYKLSFNVKEGTVVWYEYNELDDVYEVHLKDGVSTELNFTETYIKTSDVLKINFVNHIKINSAKGSSQQYMIENKPKSIWG